MWKDLDFLRSEVSRLEAAIVDRNRNSYDVDDLRLELNDFLEELRGQESTLWTQLKRSSA
jgi:hypothetical protein